MNTMQLVKTAKPGFLRFLAYSVALVAAVAPARSADDLPPLTAAEFDRGLACVDEESLKTALYGLHARLDSMVRAGRARQVALTELREGNRPVLDYQPIGSFPLLGHEPLAINWAYGMLPAVTAIFDERLDELMRPYERTGFKFRCQALGSEGDRSCEAQRPSENGRLIVALAEGRSILAEGRVVVACTLINGNPFR